MINFGVTAESFKLYNLERVVTSPIRFQSSCKSGNEQQSWRRAWIRTSTDCAKTWLDWDLMRKFSVNPHQVTLSNHLNNFCVLSLRFPYTFLAQVVTVSSYTLLIHQHLHKRSVQKIRGLFESRGQSWSQENPLGVARFVQISWLNRRFPVADIFICW